MPIPHDDCAADISGDVCCDTLWLICERIRTVATNAVTACMDASCADRDFRSFTSWGTRIEDPLGESLIVSLVRATTAPMSTSRQGRQLPVSFTRAEVRVELRETGWAQSRANDAGLIELPDFAIVAAQSKHAMGHAEKMWRGLVNAAARRNGDMVMFPVATNPHISHPGVAVGELAPLPPGAYIVGSGCNVTVDVSLP